MWNIRILTGFVVWLFLLAGCPGDDSPGSAGASDSSGSSGGATANMAPPLQGRALSKASQLVGTWMFVTEGDYVGFEFMKDGKVLVTHALSMLGGEGAGAMMTYSLMEGGRLALISPTGQTQTFEATVSGDQMELKGGQLLSDGGSQRFRKLKPGQTLSQAIEEQRQAEAKAYEERVAALESFLKQPGLVLAFADTPGAPASIALDIQSAGGGFTGRAWHDDKPPHLNTISGQVAVNQAARTAQVIVAFGNRIAPPATQPDGGGQITMNVAGAGKNLQITSQVRYGDGPTREVVLRADPKLHGQIVKRFEAELARIESLKQPMIDLLQDYAVLHGRLASTDQRRTEPDTTTLTLVRDPQTGQYRCEGVYVGARGRGELVARAAAEIAVVNDRPVLRIVAPTRQYLLNLSDPKTGRLSGQWTLGGYGQGYGAQFDVVETLDARARDAKFEAQRRAIKALGADAAFIGLAHEDSGSGMDMPIPVRLEVTVDADGSARGKADYPSTSTLMTLAGQLAETPVGPRLQLRFTGAESTPRDQIFFRSIQNGAWGLIPAAGAGPMKLTGHFTGPPLRSITLTRVGDQSTARLRKSLTEAIGAGAQLYVSRFVGWQQQGITPTVVEWRLDEGTGRITGQVVVHGRALGTNEKLVTSYEGEATEEDGWIRLEVMQIAVYGRNKAVSALKLFACEDPDGLLHLNGSMVGLPSMPVDQPTPAFPAQFDRLVELMPVATADAPTRAAVAKAIAEVAAAQATADAAAEAQRVAALEARRTKMAPFFPLFKAHTGLVITTDAPMELGTVILESQVDEENAVITGKGVDLREMPFREFTYACDLDNRGSLTITTSISETPYAFANPTDQGASGRYLALTRLSQADRIKLDNLIALGTRLQNAAQAILTVETLDAAGAKTREANLPARDLPGVVIYRDRKNDQVAAMFTAQSNRRYAWAKEPVVLRLNEPVKGKALYIKGSGPTTNLIVVINGVHRAMIGAIVQMGAATVALPPDLDILDIRLEAVGSAQARGIVLLQ